LKEKGIRFGGKLLERIKKRTTKNAVQFRLQKTATVSRQQKAITNRKEVWARQKWLQAGRFIIL